MGSDHWVADATRHHRCDISNLGQNKNPSIWALLLLGLPVLRHPLLQLLKRVGYKELLCMVVFFAGIWWWTAVLNSWVKSRFGGFGPWDADCQSSENTRAVFSLSKPLCFRLPLGRKMCLRPIIYIVIALGINTFATVSCRKNFARGACSF